MSLILKRRIGEIGGDPARVSVHGLRSGYMTEACMLGLSLPEAMAQSLHRSALQATAYFDGASAASGRAARLLP